MNYTEITDQYCGMDYYHNQGNGFLDNAGLGYAPDTFDMQSQMPSLHDVFPGGSMCSEHFASNFIGTDLAHEVMSPGSVGCESEPGTPKEASLDNFGTDLSTGCETCSNASLDESPRMLAAGSVADAEAGLLAWQMALASHKAVDASGMMPEDEPSPASPSQLAEQGFVVRNTFIHVPQKEQE